jgi:SAM-dependent methyltransferase
VEHRRPHRRLRGAAVRAGSPAHQAVFGADPAHVLWLSERIVRSLGGAAPTRVLDIGCGDGSLLVRLAESLPRSSFLGVDLSEGNVAAAAAANARSPDRGRIAVAHDDYMTIDAGRFDLIVASSSLQGIDATSEQLADKIARDAADGGRLIHVTPYRCLYNVALNTVRVGLRQVRGSATDHMILSVARILDPGQPAARLRERVDYMYLVLRHYEDGLRHALQARGFHLVSTEPAPHTSLGQPKHRLAVMSAPSHA